MEAGARVIQEIERRVEAPRRCAWCLRFLVNGVWKPGRRADDGAALPATTHTICDECIARLRREGMSV
jgi:hypothetical protein